jgi:hypothetical protein
MRKRLTLLTAVVVASLIAAVAAWAGNPHFPAVRRPDSWSTSARPAATAKATAGRSDATSGDPRVLIDNIVVAGVKEGRDDNSDRAVRGDLRLRQRRQQRPERGEQDHVRRRAVGECRLPRPPATAARPARC